eukprot:gnl/TRDRNA2_/TRDRNA2_148788_c0_seq3.p1 gnl/TRDRNA2_/TRDRNA2_148788_c0~~gnl/TRDRNA2_/TRDRNA2_148788_c0_seq3.p1  ORF type:complete len:518 (-),score=89.99 gnl/TRDRNA2_/TRDRNA2_148788_c0_seq3:28-1581(-)
MLTSFILSLFLVTPRACTEIVEEVCHDGRGDGHDEVSLLQLPFERRSRSGNGTTVSSAPAPIRASELLPSGVEGKVRTALTEPLLKHGGNDDTSPRTRSVSEEAMDQQVQQMTVRLARSLKLDDSDEVASALELQLLEAHTNKIRGNSQGVPFITLIELSTSWRNIALFIQESRQSWLPSRTPIIVLCPALPTKKLLEQLNLLDDSRIGVVTGTAKWVPDLVRAGIEEASCVVCPAVELSPTSTDEKAAIDSDAVMLFLSLDKLGVTTKAVSLFEFKRINNVGLLPMRGVESSFFDVKAANVEVDIQVQPPWRRNKSPLSDADANGRNKSPPAAPKTESADEAKTSPGGVLTYMWNKLHQEPPDRKPRFGFSLNNQSRYIAGQVYSPSAMGAMLARACYIPGIMEVMQVLIMPEAAGDMFVWQILPTESMLNRKYGECWFELIRDPLGPALALGMYRFLTEAEELLEDDPPIGYVMTNPAPDTVVSSSDLIYVLASASWGRSMYQRGLIPHSASSDD